MSVLRCLLLEFAAWFAPEPRTARNTRLCAKPGHNGRVVRAPILVLIAATLGCGLLEDEPDGTPPPVGESNGANMTTQGVGNATGGATTGGTASGTATSDGADTTVGLPDLGMGVLAVGEIAIGDGAWTPPLPCVVRFYLADQLDPDTGVAMEWEAEIPIVIDAFPFTYMLTRNDVPATVDFGTEGYIGTRCDFDGDEQLDNVGGFFPELPAELVTLPAPDVDMALQFL